MYSKIINIIFFILCVLLISSMSTSCTDEPVEVNNKLTLPDSMIVTEIRVVGLPDFNEDGLDWDSNSAPDVFVDIEINDGKSGIFFQSVTYTDFNYSDLPIVVSNNFPIGIPIIEDSENIFLYIGAYDLDNMDWEFMGGIFEAYNDPDFKPEDRPSMIHWDVPGNEVEFEIDVEWK